MKVEEEEGMGHQTRKDVIHTFQVNFFAMGLLNAFPWDFLDKEHTTSETSDIIMDILQKHETTAAEPLDVLYEALGELMFAQEEDLCYKTYLLPTGDAVSLAENVALISQGTTGLVTWEAALYLAEWALENTHIFKSKQV
ncbi:Protein-lysine N-methyltransferase EEF2KMT [Anabarilius grahami]|uniref:Protein-lysine N-methyltransferase EEF2KMT n=1 Tax=Anabarilius grahami TaxID=495550 RepID=A0A3N0Y2B9_ANAGA|nr:Protein-lysine N-methyltransferase EEF2KMT [Anabarilius grahami]